MTDDRPWLVFKSPRRGIRVKKKDVLAIGQGRAGEELVGRLPATLTEHEAKLQARVQFGGTRYTDNRPGPKTAWHGYWHPTKGARCFRKPLDPEGKRAGEIDAGVFDSDMAEEDVIGMIKAKYKKAHTEQHSRKRSRHLR